MINHPVIIIGAPRSGTNMLRDVLTRIPGYATWPCDEINLMWRHGNRAYPSDELPPELATAEVGRYLRRQFETAQRRYRARVVEKTCANSLRVPFVDACMPTARYLFITRDGMDAVASAMQRWYSPFDLRYTARKIRFVPPTDVPYYAVQFVANRLQARKHDEATAGDRVSSWWGPRLHDQEQLRRVHSLDELCAIQWQRCVDASITALAQIEPSRVHQVTYEQFVAEPIAGLRDILEFLGEATAVDPSWVADVSLGSVGKGRARLGEERVAHLTELVRPTLERVSGV